MDLKPNYVKTWVNLGIAVAHKQDYLDAARLYWNALSINPGATHLWAYIHKALLCAQRYDMIEVIREQDIGKLGAVLGVTQQPLPEPELPCKTLVYLVYRPGGQ